jgi:hypothetical protein
MFGKLTGAGAVWLALSGCLILIQAQEQDRGLAAIREYALHYAGSLPDYACTRVTQQKNSYVIEIYAHDPESFGQHPQSMPSWTTVVEEELAVAGKTESHKVLKVEDNTPLGFAGGTAQVISTISVAEFGSVLDRIFEPETGANFHWVRTGKLRGRTVLEFSFDVPRTHGARVYDNVAKRELVVGYHGLIYADADSKAVLRVETHSSNFPSESEFTGMDLTLDYKVAKIGGNEFVLPYRFDLAWHRHIPGTLGKARELPQESGVQAEYRDYRQFSAQSAVSFDSGDQVHSTITFGDVPSPH